MQIAFASSASRLSGGSPRSARAMVVEAKLLSFTNTTLAFLSPCGAGNCKFFWSIGCHHGHASRI
jgi:hypothetical protein